MPSQDVVLGLYFMTRERINAKGEGSVFSDIKEAKRAYESGAVDLQARVKVRLEEVIVDEDGNRDENIRIVDTTIGRTLVFDVVPQGLPLCAGRPTDG